MIVCIYMCAFSEMRHEWSFFFFLEGGCLIGEVRLGGGVEVMVDRYMYVCVECVVDAVRKLMRGVRMKACGTLVYIDVDVCGISTDRLA